MADYTPDPTTPVDINIFNYPIETPEAFAFWNSDHKCNMAKAFIAFCIDEANFEELAKRHGYTREWRDRMWAAFGVYVDDPDMLTIPFTELETHYWECMPNLNEGTELEQPPYIVAMTNSLCEVPFEQPFTLEVQATGAPVLTYEWFKDGVTLGILTPTHTIPSFTEADGGEYYVVVTNAFGSTKSPVITLTAKQPLPIITIAPVDQFVEDGAVATFTTDATGYTSVSWYDQGILIPGEITTTLNVVADYTASGNHNHNYSAKFSNTSGSVTTPLANLQVFTVIPVITLQPDDVTSGLGDTNVLTLDADATGYDSVQWFKKDRITGHYNPVVGQTTTTFTETVAYTGFFDEYYAEFTNAYQVIRTRVATVYVASVPIFVIGGFGLGFNVGYS